MFAEQLDYVIGVDSHRDTHALALVACATGGLLAERELPANGEGYARALAFARAQAPGRRAWAIEGTGSYGAGLTRYLGAHGERVLGVERPLRGRGRSRGKSDALDALAAARSALAGKRLPEPRAAGEREALRCLLRTREGAVAVRRAGLNALRALVVAAPEELRQELRGLSEATLLRHCLALRPHGRRDPQGRGTALALRACARRVVAAAKEAEELRREILALVRLQAPALLCERGVGPISAAQLLVSWSHPRRFPGEAAFARHAGAAPIPASSGQRERWRLDRGGDRALNRALHTIVLSRRAHDPATIAYIERRQAEGKSAREAIRCLKRYLARHLFRLLEGMPVTA